MSERRSGEKDGAIPASLSASKPPLKWTADVFAAVSELEGARNDLVRESNMTNSHRWAAAKTGLMDAVACAARAQFVADPPCIPEMFGVCSLCGSGLQITVGTVNDTVNVHVRTTCICNAPLNIWPANGISARLAPASRESVSEGTSEPEEWCERVETLEGVLIDLLRANSHQLVGGAAFTRRAIELLSASYPVEDASRSTQGNTNG